MISLLKQRAIADFWNAFRQHAPALATADSLDTGVVNRLLAKLQEIAHGLYMEFSSEPGQCELIITAERDRSLFPLVHTIVSEAPHLPGWKILALKPKLGFPVTSQWGDVTIKTADVVFAPLERQGSKAIGLRIFVPGLRPEDAKDAHKAILRAMDHGLGERGFAESITSIVVLTLPDGASKANYIPLAKLPQYIQRRKRQGKKSPTQ